MTIGPLEETKALSFLSSTLSIPYHTNPTHPITPTMGAQSFDAAYHSAASLLGLEVTGPFPYKAFVLGFMLLVFYWEEYLR